MNSVYLIGRLTKDPECVKAEADANAICRSCVAVKKSQGTDFINFTAFGKTAENMEKYLNKGALVCLQGSLRQNSYEKDGKKISRLELIANAVEYLSVSKEKESGESQEEKDEEECFPF